MYGFNDPKSKFGPGATSGASQQQKSPVMTTYPKPANSGMVGSDYSVGRGVASGGLPSATPPPPAPAPTSQPGAATAFGQKVRRGLVGYYNNSSARAEGLVKRSLLPANVVGGVARDVYRGFTGQPSPNDGRPLNVGVSLPRIDRRLVTTQPGQRTSPSTRYVPGKAAPSVTMIDNGQALPESALLPEKPKPPADGVYRGRIANGISVYGGSAAELSDGIARTNAGFGRGTPEAQQWLAGVQPLAGSPGAVPQAAAAPVGGSPQVWSATHGLQAPGHYGPATQAPVRTAILAAAGSAAGPMSQAVSPIAGQPAPDAGMPAAATVRQLAGAALVAPASGSGMDQRQLGGFPVQPETSVSQFQRVLPISVSMMHAGSGRGSVIQNPGDSTANKLQRTLMSYSVRGSPSTRAAIAQAILGEAGARQNERMQALRTQDQAALEAQRANAAAAEGNANRQLDADKFNVSAQDSREYRRQMVDLERSRPFQVGQGEGGAQGIVRSDGSYTPITDASGAPVQINQRGQGLSPDALLKSYTDQVNTINNGMGTAEEKRAARAELDGNPMFASITGVGQAKAAKAPADGSTFEAGGERYVIRKGVPVLIE